MSTFTTIWVRSVLRASALYKKDPQLQPSETFMDAFVRARIRQFDVLPNLHSEALWQWLHILNDGILQYHM